MEYTITLTLEVDSDAPFLEVGGPEANCQVILDLMRDLIYDQDYIKILYSEAEYDV